MIQDNITFDLPVNFGIPFESSQDIYSDMLVDGKTWSFIRWPYGYTHRMGMRGDTIVNGMECRKYGYVNDDGTFRFIHSSTQSGIVITRSNEPYYKKRYIGACRIIACGDF